MVELVDTLVSGTSAVRRLSSSLSRGTPIRAEPGFRSVRRAAVSLCWQRMVTVLWVSGQNHLPAKQVPRQFESDQHLKYSPRVCGRTR